MTLDLKAATSGVLLLLCDCVVVMYGTVSYGSVLGLLLLCLVRCCSLGVTFFMLFCVHVPRLGSHFSRTYVL